MTKMKKAQIKIQETAFVLIGLVLLVSIFALFYIRVSYSSLASEKEQIDKEQAISYLSKMIELPEFRCDEGLDADKLMAYKKTVANHPEYEKFWQDISSIVVRKIYPEYSSECTDNYPNCQTITIYSSGKPKYETISTFVPLCRITNTAECELALLEVSFSPTD